jgi:hypothetical protein
MGRPEKPLNAKGNPIVAFANDLRELRRRAGEPSYREMARCALFSPSVLSSAASGRRLPTLQVTLAFVDACGGDRVAWEGRWRELAGQGERRPTSVPDRALAPGVSVRAGYAPASTASGHAARFPSDRECAIGVDPTILPRPAQLPSAPATFVGRRAQLAEARSLVSGRGAAPLLVGGGIGVGKTAFALRLAEELADDLPDGQLYADLGGDGAERVSPDVVLTGVLRALGVSERHIPADATQRVGLYRSLMAERSVLVLLDDARDEAQIRPLLAAASSSVIVVTSRARLLGLDGVRRLHLGLFNRTESLSMLVALAGARRVSAEPDGAAQIAEQCGDLPLALSIAGRKIAAHPTWPLGHVAQQLSDRARLLDRLRAGDLSVRGRLESAYRRLSASARRALARLGAHAAVTVTGAPQGSAPDLPEEVADALVECGLLQHAAAVGCYRVPPMVQLFVAEQQRLQNPGGSDEGAPDRELTVPPLRHDGSEPPHPAPPQDSRRQLIVLSGQPFRSTAARTSMRSARSGSA